MRQNTRPETNTYSPSLAETYLFDAGSIFAGFAEKGKSGTDNKKKSASAKVIKVYLFFMLGIFPLFVSNFYFDINIAKYLYFVVITVIFFIIFICVRIKESGAIKAFDIFTRPSITDIGMLAFILTAIISSCCSEYSTRTLTGEMGRQNGLYTLIAYFMAYMMISRSFGFDRIVMRWFAISAGVVYFVGFLNCLGIEIFGFYRGLNALDESRFVSTIGNINFFSTFICLTLPLFSGSFMLAEKRFEKALFLSASVLGFLAAVASNSESVFLGLFTVFMGELIYAGRIKCGLKKSLLTTALMILTIKAGLTLKGAVQGTKITGLCKIVYKADWLYIVGAALAVIYLLSILVQKKSDILKPQAAKYIAIMAAAVILVFAVSMAVISNSADSENRSKTYALSKYFYISDKWGTNRGYAYRKSFEIMQNASVKNILIGSGPDTFGGEYRKVYDISNDPKKYLDNAHNEYLQYLITLGFIGLAAYMTFIAGSTIRLQKATKLCIYGFPLLLGIAGYLLQALVNVNQPGTNAFLFILIAMGERLARTVVTLSYHKPKLIS